MSSDMHSALRAEPADSDLLELAAKAAGKFIGFSHDRVGELTDEGLVTSGSGTCEVWNPLADDGDAYRLAAWLNLSLCFSYIQVSVNSPGLALRGIFIREEAMVADLATAGRRAIVRAAAEIAAAQQE